MIEAFILLVVSLCALAVAFLVEPKAFGSVTQEQIERDRYDEDKL